MAYRILAGERPGEALRRIASEQIGSALEDIADAERGLHSTVHEVRKRCKKVRGLIRLFRPGFRSYAAENAWLRDAARRLSELRDVAVLVETCDALSQRFADGPEAEPLAALREALVARRDAAVDALDADGRMASVRRVLEDVRERAEAWTLQADGFGAIAGGWKKVHQRARRGMHRARREPSVENLHEWRKRVKYHHYHLRLLRESWPSVLTPLRDSAKLLSDRLGDDHDLAVLRRVVVDEPERFEHGERDLVPGLIDQRRKELQAWAFPGARRLIDEKPAQTKRRMRRIWEAWSAEQALASALHEASREVF